MPVYYHNHTYYLQDILKWNKLDYYYPAGKNKSRSFKLCSEDYSRPIDHIH